jgi:hypothetical protein
VSRRRGERRHVFCSVPTGDGKKVAVRSSTVAGRLLGQQQLIEQQAERIVKLERELLGATSVRDHLRELTNQITRQRLVRALIRLRLVSIVVSEPIAATAAVNEAPAA